MKIVSSILFQEKRIKEIEGAFPGLDFEFYDGITAAEASFYDAEVFVTYGEDLTEEIIKKTTKLNWIMVMSAGLEKMPLAACKEKGIVVTNAGGIHKTPMAEFTLGLILQYVKQAETLWENQKAKKWTRKLPMAEVAGQSILILGVGAIGGEIARLSKAFQMKTIGVNTSGKEVEYVDQIFKVDQLEDALPQADFIVSVLPSTKATKGLLKENHFKVMKETAVFINIGRGDLVEEHVLLNVIQSEEIAHFYLDVFQDEPLNEDHPFWVMKNVTVTPHISSLTKNYLTRSIEIFKENLHHYLNNTGRYLNEIDLERGY
ncbi:D-2-hydroxyacid dehydrogenase [Neobacillus sp. LXY-4]|uniref:D-2-hydroxyacid dehydrogenase n=1 Tax=Neobacillus sp. LXY-4 TaxID=3379826 RepID=UPI003EE1291B